MNVSNPFQDRALDMAHTMSSDALNVHEKAQQLRIWVAAACQVARAEERERVAKALENRPEAFPREDVVVFIRSLR